MGFFLASGSTFLDFLSFPFDLLGFYFAGDSAEEDLALLLPFFP